jgi:hypothetical protein
MLPNRSIALLLDFHGHHLRQFGNSVVAQLHDVRLTVPKDRGSYAGFGGDVAADEDDYTVHSRECLQDASIIFRNFACARKPDHVTC